jgi:superfamily II DNA or RNA helicase
MLYKELKMFGYVYVRETIYRKFCKVVKIGITENLVNREATYITGEFIRGKYISAYEVPLSELHVIDDLLKEKLVAYHRIDKSEGGTEFYNESVLEILDTMMDSYRKLSEEELEEIKRISVHKPKLEPKSKINKLIPRDYQKTIISKSIEYFETNDKGLLVLMCGMGKTLISLWISQAMNSSKILIGVPNKLLLKQWEKEVNKIFPNIPILAIEGGITETKIKKFQEENEKFVVITTYHSSYKLELFEYDIKIFDEVHHLTSTNIDSAQEHNSFVRILNVRSRKQLGLTATMKELENFEKSVSNNDKLIFGEIIDEKNLLWAIERDIITDYQIQAIQVKEECISIKGNNLMVAAYCAVQSNSNHMLIYCNSTENAIKVIEFIKQLNPEIFCSEYYSGMTTEVQAQILKNFSESPRGIVSCVYCLGEGWDFPKLDAVLFAEKMTSNIRIVQSALRACRKNKDSPQKIAKIILPVLYKENWLDDNTNDDLKKVREVIYQMSMEDERIIQKIIFSEILSEYSSSDSNSSSKIIINDEITTKLIMKTIHRNQLGITYEKSKQIIREEKKRIPIESQKDYLELCKFNTKLHEDPQNHFGDRFIDWCDYLSIEQKYYDLSAAKVKIQEFLISDYDETFGYMNLAILICKKDKMFPPIDLWTSYYKICDIDILFANNSIPESFF